VTRRGLTASQLLVCGGAHRGACGGLELRELPSVIIVCGGRALSNYDSGLMIACKIVGSRQPVNPVRIASYAGIFRTVSASQAIMDNLLLKPVPRLRRVGLTL